LPVFCAIAAVCADGPKPPCAGEPLPAYPAPGAPPAVTVWERSDWAAPSCIGWTPATGVTLVATAARFVHGSGVDGLKQRLAQISPLPGWLYWSPMNQRGQPLIVDAYALRGPSPDQRRPDFSPAEITEAKALYVFQEDNLLGKIVYQYRVLRV